MTSHIKIKQMRAEWIAIITTICEVVPFLTQKRTMWSRKFRCRGTRISVWEGLGLLRCFMSYHFMLTHLFSENKTQDRLESPSPPYGYQTRQYAQMQFNQKCLPFFTLNSFFALQKESQQYHSEPMFTDDQNTNASNDEERTQMQQNRKKQEEKRGAKEESGEPRWETRQAGLGEEWFPRSTWDKQTVSLWQRDGLTNSMFCLCSD